MRAQSCQRRSACLVGSPGGQPAAGGYSHLVFTLPAELAAVAFTNKSMVYDLLFRTASEPRMTIAL